METKHNKASHGIGTLFFGCFLFSFGIISDLEYGKIFSWITIAIGLFLALFGTAQYTASEIKKR